MSCPVRLVSLFSFWNHRIYILSLQVSPTSTRGRSTGNSTTSFSESSPVILALFWKTLWAASWRLSSQTGSLSTTATRTWSSSWKTRRARWRPSRSSSPVFWRCVYWCWSTLWYSSRGRARRGTYCTANAPCRSGSERGLKDQRVGSKGQRQHQEDSWVLW